MNTTSKQDLPFTLLSFSNWILLGGTRIVTLLRRGWKYSRINKERGARKRKNLSVFRALINCFILLNGGFVTTPECIGMSEKKSPTRDTT